MHRLPVESGLLALDEPRLPDAAARHLKVLRVKAGERVELFDGRGATRVYAVAADGALRSAEPVVAHARPAASITLFACVTKGSRWDWTVEKATELGVARIVPVISERTIVRLRPDEREAKAARWARVAEDAARQSDAAWLPEVAAPMGFEQSLPLVRECDACFVGALVTPPPPPLVSAAADALRGRSAGAPLSLGVYVGPEGDFTPAELAALTACATPVSLGPSVLRAETAAIYSCAVLAAVIDGFKESMK